MSIFDLQGPEFLKFYAVLAVIGTIVGIIVRRAFSGGFLGPGVDPIDLEAFDIAYLAGRKRGLCNALVASLIQRKIALCTANREFTIDWASEGLPPLERKFVALTASHGSYRLSNLYRILDDEPIRRKLEARKLIVSSGRQLIARMVPALLMFGVLLTGMIKIGVGVSRHKPVTYLILLCVMVLVVGIAFCRSAFCTARGKFILKRLRDGNAALLANARVQSDTLDPADLALALALWGPIALGGTAVASFRSALIAQGVASREGRGIFAGWGNGAGGGAGCGGGGCGGGGCGGCGG